MASDYQRGTMDIAEQTATFDLVMGLTKWGSLYIGTMLLFLTLWFCTATGFTGALGTAIAVIVIGTLMLREKKDAGAH